MKFQYFTYFLNPLRQSQLIPDSRLKKDIIADILTKPIEYRYRGTTYAYVFLKRTGDYIVSSLGRKAQIRRSLPPEKKFADMQEESWPHADLLINLSEDKDLGQRIAFEQKSDVFLNPYSQLSVLADELNSKLFSTGYAIAINPITVEQKFWDFVEQHSNKIRKLSLAFNAPNLFDLKNKLSDELKTAQKAYSLTRARIELENPVGGLVIPKNAELIKQGIEYITRGGGEYELHVKGRGRKTLKSKNNISTRSFDEFDVNLKTDKEGMLLEALDKIFK